MKPPLVILGAGGHAREVLMVCRLLGRSVRVLVDETGSGGELVAQVQVVRSLSDARRLTKEPAEVLPAVGDITLRRRFVAEAQQSGWLTTEAIVAPDVYVDPSVTLGPGTYVAPGANLSVDVAVGAFAVIGRGAIVSHDSRLGDFVTLAPGVVIAGGVTIEDGAMIGIGASVRNGVLIGRDAVVGGGSFVAGNLPAAHTYGGVPARRLRSTPSVRNSEIDG